MTPRDWLASLEFQGIKLGLENIRTLLSELHEPHLTYPVAHIAGTNGKGSVAAFLAAQLEAADYRVGRFTSPHILALNERFLLNRTPIADDVLEAILVRVRHAANQHDLSPTFFEATTAVAMCWFAEAGVDIAIIEVGLGGRLDSTNVVEPTVTAITQIAMDHQAYLGDTLSKVAGEKAGILKPGVPLVLAGNPPEATDVILPRAQSLDVPVCRVGRDIHYAETGDGMSYKGPVWEFSERLGLVGPHQASNAAVATAMAELLADRGFERLTRTTAMAGLREVRWPGRLERVMDEPPVIMDVAHNPAGMAALAQSIPPCIAVLAVSSDKDAVNMLKIIAPATRELVLTQFKGSRALSVEALSQAAGSLPHKVFESLPDAVEYGLSRASGESPLLMAGSIFFIAEARQYLIDYHNAKGLQF